jgi:4-hydroxy-4-methyl-2-oxoglutarate aldolase
MDVTGLKCADLVDAMGRMHRHRCHILDLVSPTPGRILFGPAVTISYFPSCSARLDPERYNLANLFYEAVGDKPTGKVIVLASNGYTDTSMGGGTKLLRLHQNGCAGCSRMAAYATSTSLRATTSPPTAPVRQRAGEATA